MCQLSSLWLSALSLTQGLQSRHNLHCAASCGGYKICCALLDPPETCIVKHSWQIMVLRCCSDVRMRHCEQGR